MPRSRLPPTEPAFMISLTPNAIVHLKSLIAEKADAPAGAGLRLSVEKGGCAGMQYNMEIRPSNPDDEVIHQEDVSIFIDHGSIDYLRGCQIDYVESLSDSGFKLLNPNAARSCGCGTSFEPVTA